MFRGILRVQNVRRKAVTECSAGTLSSQNLRYSSSGRIMYRKMVPADEAQVRALLYDHYFERNPITRMLDMKYPDECKSMVDRFLPVAMSEGFSVVGQHIQHKTLVGVTMGRLADFQGESIIASPPLGDLSTEKGRIISDFAGNYLKELYKGQAKQWFCEHNVRKQIILGKATVHGDLGGKGIFKEMVLQVARIAKERDVQCLVAEVVSPFAKKALEVIGFEEISMVPVSEYKYKGKCIFKDNGDQNITLLAKIFNDHDLK